MFKKLMIRNITLTFAALTLFAAATLSCAITKDAKAQIYDPQGNAYSKKYYKKRTNRIGLALVRIPEAPPENFILRLSSLDTLSGCPKLGNLSYETEISGNTLWIYVGEYTVDMRNLTKTPHYDCNIAPKTPAAEIGLSRSMILDNDIQTVNFVNGPYQDTYTITLTGQYIQLSPPQDIPPSMLGHRAQNIYKTKNPLKYWFYPEKTIQIYAPGADMADAGIKSGIYDFAQKKGMTPLADIYPNFESPLVDGQYIYYVDSNSVLPAKTFEAGGHTVLGTIETKREIYGLDGVETETVPVELYAKAPGMYE